MIDEHSTKLNFDELPQWKCPSCSIGFLEVVSDTLQFQYDEQTDLALSEGWIMPDDVRGQFVQMMCCANKICKQGVSVSGTFTSYYDRDDVGDEYVGKKYRPRCIIPPPPLIAIPENTPEEISSEIQRSFGLFWFDPQSCATTIRSAIELVTNHLGQPRTNANGSFIKLYDRLENLKSTHPKLVEAGHVLRDFGNNGAHGDKIDRDKLLAAYELVEIELNRLFDDSEVRRQAAISKVKKP